MLWIWEAVRRVRKCGFFSLRRQASTPLHPLNHIDKLPYEISQSSGKLVSILYYFTFGTINIVKKSWKKTFKWIIRDGTACFILSCAIYMVLFSTFSGCWFSGMGSILKAEFRRIKLARKIILMFLINWSWSMGLRHVVNLKFDLLKIYCKLSTVSLSARRDMPS